MSLSLRLEHGTFTGAVGQIFHDTLPPFDLRQCETVRLSGRQCASRKEEVSLGLGWACILLSLSKELCARRDGELHDWMGVEVSIFSVIQGHLWNDGQGGKGRLRPFCGLHSHDSEDRGPAVQSDLHF